MAKRNKRYRIRILEAIFELEEIDQPEAVEVHHQELPPVQVRWLDPDSTILETPGPDGTIYQTVGRKKRQRKGA